MKRFTERTLSPTRWVVYDLLRRTRRHHATVAATYEWDFTDTLARIEALRARGVMVNKTAFFVKAFGEMVKAHPQLNARLFHTPRGLREVQFHEISCNLVVERMKGDREILFPLVLKNVDSSSVLEMSETIRRVKLTPLDQLEEAQKLKKISRVPRVLMKLHDYKVLSDPKYFIERFGTISVSSILRENTGFTGLTPLAPGTTLYPGSVEDKVVVRGGKPVIRKMLVCTAATDHNTVDGLVGIRALEMLKQLIEDPEHLLGEL